tara:strand:+ start:306 stop:512 length:207 start_codon:yes stop_codon:yes gene_type:complete
MEKNFFSVLLKKILIMNFKERGVTVGDLVILLIVIIFSFFIIDKIKEPKTQKQITNLYQLEIQKNISE